MSMIPGFIEVVANTGTAFNINISHIESISEEENENSHVSISVTGDCYHLISDYDYESLCELVRQSAKAAACLRR